MRQRNRVFFLNSQSEDSLVNKFLSPEGALPLKLGLRLIVRFRLTNMVLARVCKLCGQGFELEYRTGRPREYCFVCEPAGWRVVLPKHRFGRVKLRRLRSYRVSS
jgi:hypothetical protein